MLREPGSMVWQRALAPRRKAASYDVVVVEPTPGPVATDELLEWQPPRASAATSTSAPTVRRPMGPVCELHAAATMA
jgi:hypothetical protein